MNDLNLARKLRPKSFDQIVGQEISIRILKNSLYLNKFFPVYLFGGQRGCGKTTMARVFGAAVNCKNLTKFQEQPNVACVPCFECNSCNAMGGSAHPDFIEIDAASHTGVDHVRQIIDSSSYMPLIGNKKIYLIDEAHMLSKAAFNAFLKILEEPPVSVLFILATTEISKIPDTVLSRCFQVFFSPIQDNLLGVYIKNICQSENIEIDENALDVLVAETGGSVRDAINLLERVRFSGERISEETILRVLGKVSPKELYSLFDAILDKNHTLMLTKLQQMNVDNGSAQNLWDMLIQLGRILLWAKYGVKNIKSNFRGSVLEFDILTKKCSINRLHAILQLMWTQEELFLKTSKKHAFLEMVLLQMCEQTNVMDLKDIIAAVQNLQHVGRLGIGEPGVSRYFQQYDGKNDSGLETKSVQVLEFTAPNKVIDGDGWQAFLQGVSHTNDQLLYSIFLQAVFVKFDSEKKVVHLKLSNSGKFFKDKIEDSRILWFSSLAQVFNGCTGFIFVDDNLEIETKVASSIIRKPLVDELCVQAGDVQLDKCQFVKNTYKNGEPMIVDIQNKSKWPVANLLINYFPGKISKKS